MADWDALRKRAFKAAAEVCAKTMREITSSISQRTTDAIRTTASARSGLVWAGHHGGEWGWVPITAYMFETGARHPLFGHPPWYAQPHRPFIEETIDAAGQDAAEVYMDTLVDAWCDEHGFE